MERQGTEAQLGGSGQLQLQAINRTRWVAAPGRAGRHSSSWQANGHKREASGSRQQSKRVGIWLPGGLISEASTQGSEGDLQALGEQDGRGGGGAGQEGGAVPQATEITALLVSWGQGGVGRAFAHSFSRNQGDLVTEAKIRSTRAPRDCLVMGPL